MPTRTSPSRSRAPETSSSTRRSGRATGGWGRSPCRDCWRHVRICSESEGAVLPGRQLAVPGRCAAVSPEGSGRARPPSPLRRRLRARPTSCGPRMVTVIDMVMSRIGCSGGRWRGGVNAASAGRPAFEDPDGLLGLPHALEHDRQPPVVDDAVDPPFAPEVAFGPPGRDEVASMSHTAGIAEVGSVRKVATARPCAAAMRTQRPFGPRPLPRNQRQQHARSYFNSTFGELLN